MKIILLFIPLILLWTSVNAQNERKKLNAHKIEADITIDGVLNEAQWQNAPIANDFVEFTPYNGKQSSYKSEVRILFTDYAIYIGAYLYDNSPDSIMRQLSKRDDLGQTDYFGITFDPYNDGLTGYTFIVTPSNVQYDARQSSYEDSSWDGVWESKTSTNSEGWLCEIEIPYSELRFPKRDVQIWGINFTRNVQRTREKSFWNHVDIKESGFLRQAGELHGIVNIKPPLRLSFTPYVSAYMLNESKNTGVDYSFRGGLDLKYGINESYTLDMMLIPDFGQVESDDKILNISAFETYYAEKRAFFTEGTELFDKGEIFYSRRIGSVKQQRRDADFNLGANDSITKNPTEASLINVTKLSGRNKKGFGVGVLNGLSKFSQVTIQDTLTGAERKIESQPFTNYNVLVLDQSLKNNSSISFTNTNYIQPDYDYLSNVAATDMHFETKGSNYAFNGIAAISYISDTNQYDSTGIKYDIGFEKISGNFMFGYEQSLATQTYNQNDMGFLSKTNELENEFTLKYNIYDPFWRLLNLYNRIEVEHLTLYSEKEYIGTEISFKTHATFRNFLSWGIDGVYVPGSFNDFYEPRVDGRVFVKPGYFGIGTYISPDYRKKFVVDANVGRWQSNYDNWWGYWGSVSPIIRFNDKLNMRATCHFSGDVDDIGYADRTSNNDTIYFGQRDIKTLINSINVNYNFNADMAISFKARHYWRGVKYKEFYTLNENGSLAPESDFSTDDVNSNYFNIDLAYTWRFAPGSELSIVWKNSIEEDANKAIFSYYDNVSDLLDFDKQNSISFRVIYYIDYLKINRLF